MRPIATRLLDHPIIYPNMDDRMGENIGTPSLIRVPDWVPNPLGRYYLYFSHHIGRYIRMAYADDLLGPWAMYSPGVLDLSDSHFPTDAPPLPEDEDPPAWVSKSTDQSLHPHIASPAVYVDRENQRIVMYYHGILTDGLQGTRFAVSQDGVSFTAFEPLLGPEYFRICRHGGWIYAITFGGLLYRSASWEKPFEAGPRLVPFAYKDGLGEGFRHGEIFVQGNVMHVLYHRMGDRPERILHATVDMSGDWLDWVAGEPVTLLEPELEWEGAKLPLQTSTMGMEPDRVRQLRDPCLFTDDDGRTYLIYVGAGESGIGIASVAGL